jgi:hypothetical protein
MRWRAAQAGDVVPADVGVRVRRGLGRSELEAAGPRSPLGVCVAGPLVCGASQAVNDWFDRDVDAINEPGAPIPSGRVPGHAWGLGLASRGARWRWRGRAARHRARRHGARARARLGVQRAAAAPQAERLVRQPGLRLSYESLAWITGAAVALGGARPDGARAAARPALRARRARHHDAQRLQVGRRRPRAWACARSRCSSASARAAGRPAR